MHHLIWLSLLSQVSGAAVRVRDAGDGVADRRGGHVHLLPPHHLRLQLPQPRGATATQVETHLGLPLVKQTPVKQDAAAAQVSGRCVAKFVRASCVAAWHKSKDAATFVDLV